MVFSPQADLRHRLTAFDGACDCFANHGEEAVAIFRIGDTFRRQLLCRAHAEECRPQLRPFAHCIAKINMCISRQASTSCAVREELEFLDFPAVAMSVVLALRQHAPGSIALAINHRDGLATHATGTYEVIDAWFRHAVADSSLEILAPEHTQATTGHYLREVREFLIGSKLIRRGAVFLQSANNEAIVASFGHWMLASRSAHRRPIVLRAGGAAGLPPLRGSVLQRHRGQRFATGNGICERRAHRGNEAPLILRISKSLRSELCGMQLQVGAEKLRMLFHSLLPIDVRIAEHTRGLSALFEEIALLYYPSIAMRSDGRFGDHPIVGVTLDPIHYHWIPAPRSHADLISNLGSRKRLLERPFQIDSPDLAFTCCRFEAQKIGQLVVRVMEIWRRTVTDKPSDVQRCLPFS